MRSFEDILNSVEFYCFNSAKDEKSMRKMRPCWKQVSKLIWFVFFLIAVTTPDSQLRRKSCFLPTSSTWCLAFRRTQNWKNSPVKASVTLEIVAKRWTPVLKKKFSPSFDPDLYFSLLILLCSALLFSMEKQVTGVPSSWCPSDQRKKWRILYMQLNEFSKTGFPNYCKCCRNDSTLATDTLVLLWLLRAWSTKYFPYFVFRSTSLLCDLCLHNQWSNFYNGLSFKIPNQSSTLPLCHSKSKLLFASRTWPLVLKKFRKGGDRCVMSRSLCLSS